MKSKKQTKRKQKSIIFYILLILACLAFYLKQQYTIIKLQGYISQMYDELAAEEALNKRLKIEFQHYTDPEYLKKYAQQLNFVAISDSDILIIE